MRAGAGGAGEGPDAASSRACGQARAGAPHASGRTVPPPSRRRAAARAATRLAGGLPGLLTALAAASRQHGLLQHSLAGGKWRPGQPQDLLAGYPTFLIALATVPLHNSPRTGWRGSWPPNSPGSSTPTAWPAGDIFFSLMAPSTALPTCDMFVKAGHERVCAYAGPDSLACSFSGAPALAWPCHSALRAGAQAISWARMALARDPSGPHHTLGPGSPYYSAVADTSLNALCV